MNDIEREIRILKDRAEIHDLLARYCRGIDRLDGELLKQVYHRDSHDDHGAFVGNGHDFVDFIVDRLRGTTAFHTVTHSLIEVDGDRAIGESYFIAYHVFPGGRSSIAALFGDAFADTTSAIDRDHEYLAGGRYIDRFVREGERWQIMRRRVMNEWSHVGPLTHDRSAGSMVVSHVPGLQSRSDPAFNNRWS